MFPFEAVSYLDRKRIIFFNHVDNRSAVYFLKIDSIENGILRIREIVVSLQDYLLTFDSN